jgi:predicted ATPase/class 3 adenylate cyclase
VTVLFCDLVGSTEIAERLDPEEYRELLDAYLELAFAEIARLDGIVNQLAGDGFMALFGAPTAHEDAPQRAVRAALAIRDALERFNQRRRPADGPELCARIGINTGMVVVGHVGTDFKMDYTAIGDTTNLAARLQSLAEPGTILVSDATYRLVHGHVRATHVGPLEVRGKSERVEAWEILGLGERATPMAIAKARGLTPLVGREQELAQFLACFERVQGGLPQMVAVTGDAGSGKSRLVWEFKQELKQRDATLFEARCSSLSRGVPGALWRDMLRNRFEIARGDEASAVQQKIALGVRDLDPDLDDAFPLFCHFLGVPLADSEPPPSGAEALSKRLFRPIARLIVAESRRSAAVLLFEDLHWIDPVSQELLAFAAARLEGERMMLVVTYRDDFRPQWQTDAALTQLRLRPLPDEEVAEIVRARAGGRPPAELERRIVNRAEGNPLFAEELTRMLADQGLFAPADGRVSLTRPVEQIHIPDTLQELLGARLDRLGPAAKRVAQVASVVGRQFRAGELRELLEGESLELTDALEELQERGVVHQKDARASDEYRFGESLTQDVAYESLLLRERRQLHGRIAELLEADATARPALIAHHLARAQDRERAIDALLRAARDAEELPSFSSAFELYREAWSLAEAVLDEEGNEEQRRPALDSILGLVRMATLYSSTGQLDVERSAERGRELARQLGDDRSLSALYALEGIMATSGDQAEFERGIELIERGIELAEQAGLEAAAMSSRRGLGNAYIADGRLEDGNATLAEALAGLERLGEAQAETPAWFGARYVRDRGLFHSDRLEEAAIGALQTYERARAAANHTVTTGSAATLALVGYERGDWPEAKRWADEAVALATEIGNSASLRLGLTVALGASVATGSAANTGDYTERLNEVVTDWADVTIHAATLVEVLLAAGEIALAERVAESARRRSGGRLRRLQSELAIAAVQARRGRQHFADARRGYQRAIELAGQIGLASGLAAAYIGAAELARAWDADDKRREFARQALEVAEKADLGRRVARAQALLRD